jgi:hypothetical protein
VRLEAKPGESGTAGGQMDMDQHAGPR